jgi:hypothetical protein
MKMNLQPDHTNLPGGAGAGAPALPALFDIEHALLELTEIDEESIPTPELLERYRADLELAIRGSIEKRERIAWRLFDLTKQAAVKRAAAKVHTEKASELLREAGRRESAADILKNYVLGVMKTLPKPKTGARKLEGETATFTAKGAPPSVEIFDESLVPDKYKYVTVRVNLTGWRALMAAVKAEAAKGGEYPDLVRYGVALEACPTTVNIADKTELKEALQKTVKCRACNDGKSKDGGGPCPECEAMGTKPVTIPGVRLITDKFRLEVA